MTCTSADEGTTATGSLSLSPEQHMTEVRTGDPSVRYEARVLYENRTSTELAVNANGDTYGTSATGLQPDLISVIATNGRLGHAYATDLQGPDIHNPQEAIEYMDAPEAGAINVVPVHESDGETVIGEFQAAGGGTSETSK